MSLHKNQVNLDPDTKNNSFSTATQKPKSIPPLHWNRVNIDHPHNNPINFIPTLNEVTSSSIPNTETKSILTTHIKTKAISMLLQKSSDLRRAYKNQVNFDYLHKNQVNWSPH